MVNDAAHHAERISVERLPRSQLVCSLRYPNKLYVCYISYIFSQEIGNAIKRVHALRNDHFVWISVESGHKINQDHPPFAGNQLVGASKSWEIPKMRVRIAENVVLQSQTMERGTLQVNMVTVKLLNLIVFYTIWTSNLLHVTLQDYAFSSLMNCFSELQ